MSRTRASGQLLPLEDRMSTHAMIRRQEKLQRRDSAILRGSINSIYQLLGRGFVGRFKWLLLGK